MEILGSRLHSLNTQRGAHEEQNIGLDCGPVLNYHPKNSIQNKMYMENFKQRNKMPQKYLTLI